MIEFEESVAVLVGKWPEELDASQRTPGVVLRLHEIVFFVRSDTQWIRSRQQPLQRELQVLVGGKDDELLHPKIPDVSNVPRLAFLCRFRSRGCSVPKTMSVDPASSLAKHSTSHGRVAFKMTVE